MKAADVGFQVCLRVIRAPCSRHAVPAGPLSISHLWLSLGPESLYYARTLASWKATAGVRRQLVPGPTFPISIGFLCTLGKEVENFGMSGSLRQAAPWFLVVPQRSSQEVPLAKPPSCGGKGPALCCHGCEQVCNLGNWEGDVQCRGGTLRYARYITPKGCETSGGRGCVSGSLVFLQHQASCHTHPGATNFPNHLRMSSRLRGWAPPRAPSGCSI